VPFPSHPRTLLRRRSLLASAAGIALLAGCSGASDSAATSGSLSAADRARARAARDSEALSERYTAVLAAHPGLASRLRPLRAEVMRHAKAFGGTGTAASGSTASSSASSSVPSSPSSPASPASSSVPASPSDSAGPSGSGSASPGASAVPADPKSALAGLAAAEQALADRRAKALLDVPGELARLMASVAAAGAAHAYLLKEGAK
jgi:hypothetical protein